MNMNFKSCIAWVAIAFIAVLWSSTCSAQAPVDGKTVVPLQTSINALMVDMIDQAAHEIWEAGYAEKLSGRDWQMVELHAIQLIGAGSLITLPGTGPADKGWVTSPAWKEWSQKMVDVGLAAQKAAKAADQKALEKLGGNLVDVCEGCHKTFKPEVPTEGIMHIPHYSE